MTKPNNSKFFIAVFPVLIMISIIITSCMSTNNVIPTTNTSFVEAAYETETPTVKPTVTETPAPTATAEATATQEVEAGKYLTREEIKENVDWYMNLSDAELNAIVQGNLWSMQDYIGDNDNDSRPKDNDGKVLSQKQDLGFLQVYEKNFGGELMEIRYYNAINLGATMVESGGMEYVIGAFGMKDAFGNRTVFYASPGIEGVDGSFEFVEKNILKDNSIRAAEIISIDGKRYFPKMAKDYQKKVVLISTFTVTRLNDSAGESEKEEILLRPLIGDESLYNTIIGQYRGIVTNSIQDQGVTNNEILKENYTEEELTKFGEIWAMVVPK